jgi:hypothetical protein
VALDGAAEEGDHTRSARSILSQCHGPEERAEFALRLLLDHVRGRSGFLFSYVSEQLSLSAPQHGEEPPTELLTRLRSEIAGNVCDDDNDAATVVTRGSASGSLPPPMPAPDTRQVYRTYLLTMPGREDLRVVGAFAVALGEHALRAPQQAFLQAVARSLFEAGDAGSTDTRTR